MSDGTTNLEVLIQIREELAGLRKTRTELQCAKLDAGKLGDALKQGLGIGTGMQMVTMAVSALKSGLQNTVAEALRLSGELKDTSEALGVSTTALQTFRLELKAGGVDAARLSMAISEQTRSLAEARDSGSAAAQAYRALGLNAAQIERLSVEDRLIAIVRATNSATDKTLAYSAAAQILGARGLPQFLGALPRLGSDGVASVTAMYQQQGLLLSDASVQSLDRTSKTWERYWQSIVVGSGEATNSLTAYHAAAIKAVSGDLPGAGADVRAANASDSWGARFANKLVSGEGMPGGMRAAGLLFQSLGLLSKPTASAAPETAAVPGATPGSDSSGNSALERRQTLLAALKTSQTELAQIQDAAATTEANEALTVEQKAAAKRQSLAAEVAARQQIVDLLERTQATGDFRDQSEKDAEMLKAKGDLQRAQNALAAQGNTVAQQQARELFRLETEAIAAEAAGNTKLAEQKREQAKQLQLTAQLEGQQPALVQARIAAERQLTETQRARAAQELDFSRRIGEVVQAVALIEADNTLTESERRAKIIPLLAEQNRLIRERIALLEQDTRLQQGDQTALDLQKTIDDLRKQLSETQAKAAQAAGPETFQMRGDKSLRDLSDPSQHYQTAEAGVQGGLTSWYTQVGTMADQLATSISSNLQNAVDAVSNGITGWIQGTMTWRQALASIGSQIFGQLISSIVRMGTEWLLQQAMVRTGMITTAALGTTLKAQETATTIATETAKTPILATNAGLASVSSYGAASIIGIALLLAGIAAIAALAFESGGIIPGGEKLIRVNEAGTESVLNARASALLGADTIAALNAGNLASLTDLLSADVTSGIAAPVVAMQQTAPVAQAAVSGGTGEPLSLHVGVMSKQQQAAEFFSSAQGQKVLIDANRATARLYG